MTDGLRWKSESFSMWVKPTLLSPSCIKTHCTACPVLWGNDRVRWQELWLVAVPAESAKASTPATTACHGGMQNTSAMNLKCLWTTSAPSRKHQPTADPVGGQKKGYCFLVLSLPWAAVGKGTQLSPGLMQLTVENSEMHLKAHGEQKNSML